MKTKNELIEEVLQDRPQNYQTLVSIIRDQQKQIDMLVGALESIEFAVTKEEGKPDFIEKTLAKIKSGEWL